MLLLTDLCACQALLSLTMHSSMAEAIFCTRMRALCGDAMQAGGMAALSNPVMKTKLSLNKLHLSEESPLSRRSCGMGGA